MSAALKMFNTTLGRVACKTAESLGGAVRPCVKSLLTVLVGVSAVASVTPHSQFGYTLADVGDERLAVSVLQKNTLWGLLRARSESLALYFEKDLRGVYDAAFESPCQFTCASAKHGKDAVAAFLVHARTQRKLGRDSAVAMELGRRLDESFGLYQATVLLESSWMSPAERHAHSLVMAVMQSGDPELVALVARGAGEAHHVNFERGLADQCATADQRGADVLVPKSNELRASFEQLKVLAEGAPLPRESAINGAVRAALQR